jgi:predicted Rossmann-fold nucleotide-binding protein
LFDHMIEQKFLQEKFRSMAIIDEKPDSLLDKFLNYLPPTLKTYE